MRKVEERSVPATADFKIIYGEFMDKAVVLPTRMKEIRNEIVFAGNSKKKPYSISKNRVIDIRYFNRENAYRIPNCSVV